MTPALQWKRRACCSGMEGILGAMIGKYYCFFFGAVDVIFCMLYSCILIHVALYQNNPNLSKDEDITVDDERWLPSGQSSSG